MRHGASCFFAIDAWEKVNELLYITERIIHNRTSI